MSGHDATPRLLRALAGEDRRVVLRACTRREHGPGAFVFHAGAPAEALHLVLDGRFAVRTSDADGASAIIAVLGPGDAFGEVGLLAGRRQRTAAVSALEDGVTLELDRRAFAALCHARPSVRELVEQQLADDVDRLTGLLREALHADAESRVLRRLVTLAETYRTPSGEVTIMLTQDEIAQLAGSSRPTVNRVLRALERAGALRLGRGRVHVLDAAALAGAGRA